MASWLERNWPDYGRTVVRILNSEHAAGRKERVRQALAMVPRQDREFHLNRVRPAADKGHACMAAQPMPF